MKRDRLCCLVLPPEIQNRLKMVHLAYSQIFLYLGGFLTAHFTWVDSLNLRRHRILLQSLKPEKKTDRNCNASVE